MRNRNRGGPNGDRYNGKRRILSPPGSAHEMARRTNLAGRVAYAGNPQHKRDPGDFGLHPPAAPRQNATLCDGAGILRRVAAERLLKEGILSGLISERFAGDFPAQIWAVADDGTVFEAQLENQELGRYHGYPLPRNDPFRDVVLGRCGRQ